MNVVYFSLGGFVFALFILKRELLVRRNSFILILTVSAALFLLGIIILITSQNEPSATGALLVPLLSLAAYRLLRTMFLKWVGREPQDTYLNWTSGFGVDRVFNIVYVAVAGCIWIFTPLLVSKFLVTA